MGIDIETRQDKFRAKMKDSGKRQRTFFLSDAAMDSLKKLKEETQAPSINHALESMLTSQILEVKSITVHEPSNEQKAIIEQAKKVIQLYDTIIKSPKGKRQGEEIAFFDGLKILAKLLE